MDYRKKFRVKPGSRVRLDKLNPDFLGECEDPDVCRELTAQNTAKMTGLQYQLYAEGGQSLLIVLQALDAGGKDGVVNHVLAPMNPQGCRVCPFKSPTPEELAHDFLWRVHQKTPRSGEVVVFNRSHYEDVLIARVHKFVPKSVWSARYDRINEFEELLMQHGTKIIKFFLHISKEEQLKRFIERLDDPAKHWKISESDYTEREYWDDYIEAFEDVFRRCSTERAPWFIIPSNSKAFRNLAVSQIIVDTMEEMDMKIPPARVDIADIRTRAEAALSAEKKKYRK